MVLIPGITGIEGIGRWVRRGESQVLPQAQGPALRLSSRMGPASRCLGVRRCAHPLPAPQSSAGPAAGVGRGHSRQRGGGGRRSVWGDSCHLLKGRSVYVCVWHAALPVPTRPRPAGTGAPELGTTAQPGAGLRATRARGLRGPRLRLPPSSLVWSKVPGWLQPGPQSLPGPAQDRGDSQRPEENQKQQLAAQQAPGPRGSLRAALGPSPLRCGGGVHLLSTPEEPPGAGRERNLDWAPESV